MAAPRKLVRYSPYFYFESSVRPEIFLTCPEVCRMKIASLKISTFSLSSFSIFSYRLTDLMAQAPDSLPNVVHPAKSESSEIFLSYEDRPSPLLGLGCCFSSLGFVSSLTLLAFFSKTRIAISSCMIGLHDRRVPRSRTIHRIPLLQEW